MVACRCVDGTSQRDLFFLFLVFCQGGCAVCRRSVGFADDPVQVSGFQLEHQAVAEEQSGKVIATSEPLYQLPRAHVTFMLRVST